MKAEVSLTFKNVLNKYFDYRSEFVDWTRLNTDWQKAFQLNAHLLSNENNEFLETVLTEIHNIVMEMPGPKSRLPTVDWNMWTDDDQFLGFLVSRESLSVPLSKEGYLNAIDGAVKSGLFARPFKDEERFLIEIHKYLGKFLSDEDDKKYRVVRAIAKHPTGTSFQILKSGLTIEQASNLSVGYMTSDGILVDNIFFEEDI